MHIHTNKLLLHFYEDGAKRQDASQQHDVEWLQEPLLLWYWFRHCVDPTRVIWLARDVPAQNGPHKVQWEDDKQTDTGHRELCIG